MYWRGMRSGAPTMDPARYQRDQSRLVSVLVVYQVGELVAYPPAGYTRERELASSRGQDEHAVSVGGSAVVGSRDPANDRRVQSEGPRRASD